MEVVVALVGAIVKDMVVILGGLGGVRVNREQLMAGKEEFDLSNRVVIGAKRILALLLHELNLIDLYRVVFVSNKV